ncbi:MAG: radical SAM protein [Hyphomicrobium sp.]|nr:MAG: radical SAM protein [Hyphomicrobium sp.]
MGLSRPPRQRSVAARSQRDEPVTVEPKTVTAALPVAKFADPDRTAKGEPRATVALTRLDTLWINTGTLCNITCRNCYIESSPTNDRLAYITAAEVAPFLAEAQKLGTREIGFTGGEPFLNPEFETILTATLESGFEALVLTNAMAPMQRPGVKTWLLNLHERFAGKLTLRVSLDHFTEALHDEERGPGSFAKAVEGTDWLLSHGLRIAIAGRTCWGESHGEGLAGYARLFEDRGWPLDAHMTRDLVLFPEMDGALDVPEITPACWGILNTSPGAMMCATSRMVVKRKDAATPAVLPCTLLPYDERFEMGETLAKSARADGGMFDRGAVKLAHPHCSRFCVLGGGSCS